MLSPLQGHDSGINSVTFSPDGSKIISGSDDKTIRVWDASTGVEMLSPLQGHDSGVSSIAFSPDGSKIISGSEDHTIRVWGASTGVVLPHTPSPAMDEPTIGALLTNINTGRYMGALPVDTHFYSGKVHGSTYVGWTGAYKLVLVHFPEQ